MQNEHLFKFISVAPARLLDKTGIKDAYDHVKNTEFVKGIGRKNKVDQRKAAEEYIIKPGLIGVNSPGMQKLLQIATAFKGTKPIDESTFLSAVLGAFRSKPGDLFKEPIFKQLCSEVYLSLLVGRLANNRTFRHDLSLIAVAARVCALIEAVAVGAPDVPKLLARPWMQMIRFKGVEKNGRMEEKSPEKVSGSGSKISGSETVGKTMPDLQKEFSERDAALSKTLLAIRAAYANTPPSNLIEREPAVTIGSNGKNKPLRAVTALSKEVQPILKQFGLKTSTAEQLAETEEFLLQQQNMGRREMRRVTRNLSFTPKDLGFGTILGLPKPWNLKPLFGVGDSYIKGAPKSVGSPSIVGEGMLIRVEDKVIGYEPGAIAKIVNIPASATKSRETSLRVRTEESSEAETSESTSKETSVETDERSTLHTMSQDQISFEMGAKAAGGFSASYGPVSVEASAESSMAFGSSSASSTASEYAKSVIEKAVERINRSKRELTRRSRIVEVTDLEKEGYDNSRGSNVTAVYHWVNEVHEARLLNYGSRLLMEFLIPRPGAVLLWSMTSAAQSSLPTAPTPPDLRIEDIEPGSFTDLLEEYGITDAPPPPVGYRFVSKVLTVAEDLKDQTDTRKNYVVADGTLAIPEGYYVKRYWAALLTTRPRDASFKATDRDPLRDARYAMAVGDHYYSLSGKRTEGFYREHDPEKDVRIYPRTGVMPIVVTGIEDRSATVTVILGCLPTPELMMQWRMEMYAAIQQGYQRKLSEYEDKLRLARMSQALSGAPRNPEQNRSFERDEIKRSAISMLTAQHYESFWATTQRGPLEIPGIRIDEAKVEGEYVEFFERSCEWTQIEYLLYPYFWSDPEKTWLQSLQMRMDDLKHEEFLKAAYARVVVPVRPGFEAAMLTYLSNPDRPVIWDTQNFADVDMDDELYFPIWKAIMERQGQSEIAPEQVGEAWRFNVPTNHQIIGSGQLTPPPAIP